MTVPKSGHFVPADNYPASKSYLDDFVKFRGLECKNATGCGRATQMCAMMNHCFESEGKGQCGTNGQCVCGTGSKGSDCAYTPLGAGIDDYPDFNFKTLGSQWFYAT